MSTSNENESVIIGRNAVIEALRAGVSIDKVFIAKSEIDSTLKHIASKAREAGAVVVEADKRKLDSLCPVDEYEGHSVHQGVVAIQHR